MISDGSSEAARGEFSPSLREDGAPVNPFTAADVAAILRERGWLNGADVTVARVFRPEELALPIPASKEAGGNKQDLEVWLEDGAGWARSQRGEGSESLPRKPEPLVEAVKPDFPFERE